MKKIIPFVLVLIIFVSAFFVFRKTSNQKEEFNINKCIQELKADVLLKEYAVEQIEIKFEKGQLPEKVESMLPKGYNIYLSSDNKIFYIKVPTSKEIESVCELRSLMKFDKVDLLYIKMGE